MEHNQNAVLTKSNYEYYNDQVFKETISIKSRQAIINQLIINKNKMPNNLNSTKYSRLFN